MKLAEVVPWGRTLAEYQRMFALRKPDMSKRILGVGDGPASFNAEMTALGHQVVSVDPIYAFSAQEIGKRVDETCTTVLTQMRNNTDQYNWTTFTNVDQLGEERMQAMQQFLGDYEAGKAQGRYQLATLPELPFANQSFDMALCSHLLFLYSAQLSADFHLASVRELIRVANDVRIFPLIDLAGQPSPYLSRVLDDCQTRGVAAEIITVDYHFQKGAYQMLRLSSQPD